MTKDKKKKAKAVSKPYPLHKMRADRASGKATNADIARYGGTNSNGKTPNYKPRKGVSTTASTVDMEIVKQANQKHRDKRKAKGKGMAAGGQVCRGMGAASSGGKFGKNG